MNKSAVHDNEVLISATNQKQSNHETLCKNIRKMLVVRFFPALCNRALVLIVIKKYTLIVLKNQNNVYSKKFNDSNVIVLLVKSLFSTWRTPNTVINRRECNLYRLLRYEEDHSFIHFIKQRHLYNLVFLHTSSKFFFFCICSI